MQLLSGANRRPNASSCRVKARRCIAGEGGWPGPAPLPGSPPALALSQRPRPGKDPGPLARNQQHARKGLCVAVGGWGGAGGTVPVPCPAGAGRTGSYTVTEDRSVSPTLPFHTGNAEAQRSKVTFPGQTAKLGPGSESLDPTQGRGDLKVRSLPAYQQLEPGTQGKQQRERGPPRGRPGQADLKMAGRKL